MLIPYIWQDGKYSNKMKEWVIPPTLVAQANYYRIYYTTLSLFLQY